MDITKKNVGTFFSPTKKGFIFTNKKSFILNTKLIRNCGND